MGKLSRFQAMPIIFAFVLILGAFVVVAPNAVSADQEGDFTYTVSGGNATVTGYTGAGGAIIIPSTLGGHETVAIGDNAFSNNTDLTSVTISDNVTYIGYYAFYNCSSLISITIPDNVTFIGDFAFYNCTSLASVAIPSKLTSIQYSVFSHCASLTSVTIPSNVTIIKDAAFFGCSSLTSVTIPEKVISIGDAAFRDCTSLASVTIPENVTIIMDGAFAYCISLTSVTIPRNVTTIERNMFFHCNSLVSVTILSNLTSFKNATFAYCTSLTSLIIPENVTQIGVEAFAHCTSLTSMTIPSNVTTIGNDSFSQCDSLTSIVFKGLVAPAVVGDGWVDGTPAEIRGHAYAASNFPSPGGDFHGLIMGDVIPLLGTPGAPQNFSAAAEYRKVVLTWSVPLETGNSTIINYALYRCDTEFGLYSLIASPTVLIYNNTALTNGHTYWYKVCAVNSLGEGARTDPISAVPFTVPDAPTGLVALAGDGQVSLNWTAPAFNGGRSIDYYVVYQDDVALLDHPTGTSAVITGLTIEQSYTFTVAAHNIAGLGEESEESSATPYTVPSAPIGLTATPGNGVIELNWNAPSYLGSGPIAYRLFRDNVDIYNGSAISFQDSGLVKGVIHSYKVAANNSAGWGPNSTAVQSAATGVPDAPLGLTAAAGDERVDLNWTEPSYLGPGVIAYHLFRDGDLIWSGSATFYNDTDLVNGIEYTYSVAANNSVGWGLNSSDEEATPIGPPSEPIGLTAVAGNELLDLNWNAPEYLGPGTIVYHLFRDGVEIWNGTAITYEDAPLTKGVEYSYTVAAQNSLGWGQNCSAVLATPFGIPDAPWGLSAVSGDQQASLSWNPVNYSGPGTLIYHLFRDGVEVWSGINISYDDTGLINGQAYEYQVAASNSVGWSLNSSTASVTPQGPPTEPLGLMAEAGNGYVNLSWSAPSYAGPGLLTYHLFRNGTEVWSGVELAYNDTGLVDFLTYNYTVAANNSIGLGPIGNAAEATPLPTEWTPSAPMNFVATPGNGNVTLTWDAPQYSNDSAVSGYMIFYGTSPTSITDQIPWDQLVCVVSGLTKGQEYFFNVVARNDAGWGQNSSGATVTPYGVPDAPSVLEADPGNALVNLNWSVPAYTGPGTITYRVYRDDVMVWSGTTNTYVDSGLINGHEYAYQVSAGNSIGWSSNTSIVTATPSVPPTPPGVPTGLHIEIVDGQAKLNWTAPIVPGTSPITGYKVYRSNTSDGTYVLVASPTGLNYTDTGLTNGHTYWYKVSAVSAVGEGAKCTAVSIVMPQSSTDDTMLILIIVIIIIAALLVLLLIWRKRKG
jgi:hypothetical protein